MGYRSVVGFNIVGDLESVLDIFHSLYIKAYYVNGVSTKKILDSSPKDFKVPEQEFWAADLVTSFDLSSHKLEDQSTHIPDCKKILDLYSLNFYHDWIKWGDDIETYNYSFIKQYSKNNNKTMASSLFRQGENFEDYDEQHLTFKDGESIPGSFYFNLFDVYKKLDDDENGEPMEDDESDEIGMHINYNDEQTISFYVKEADKNHYQLNPTFLKIEDAYLSTLCVEQRFMKAIQYCRTDILEELLKTNYEVLSSQKNIGCIEKKLEDFYEEQFSKNVSKELYLNILKTLIANKLPFQSSWGELTQNIVLVDEKIKAIQIQKELLSEDLIENSQRKTLKL